MKMRGISGQCGNNLEISLCIEKGLLLEGDTSLNSHIEYCGSPHFCAVVLPGKHLKLCNSSVEFLSESLELVVFVIRQNGTLLFLIPKVGAGGGDMDHSRYNFVLGFPSVERKP